MQPLLIALLAVSGGEPAPPPAPPLPDDEAEALDDEPPTANVYGPAELQDGALMGVGGMGMLGALAPDAAVEQYLDEMLWLDETRVADEASNVSRSYAFFQGRDKRAIRLDELLALAGEDELLQRHNERTSARGWIFAGGFATGTAMMIGSAALFVATLLGPTVATPLGMTPAELQGITLWPTVGLLSGGLLVVTGSAFVPAMIWPPSEDVPEHELRRSVRQSNERLREQLGINARRDEIPTGVPE